MPKAVFLHIEEPELSLDPTSQVKLTNEIIRQSFYDTSDNRTVGLVLATHSPYIVNNLNLLIKAHDCGTHIDGAHIDYENLSAYMIKGGNIIDLKIKNLHYINTERLSQDINEIYDKYEELHNKK